MKEKRKQLELFLKSSSFYRGIRIGLGIVTPLAILNLLGYSAYAPAVAVGTFLIAPSDIPGSFKRKIYAFIITILLTMLVTTIVLFAKPYLTVLLLVLAVITFGISLLSVYGFRASLVSFSGLLAMVISLAVQKASVSEILTQVALMGIGGIWYLTVAFIFRKLTFIKDQNQLLSDTLLLIGNYLKLRAKLLTQKNKREERLKKTFALQHQINDKHETLREALLAARKKSGRSQVEEKQLLILSSSINIFELIEATHMDYKVIDGIFGEQSTYLKSSQNLSKVMGNHLIRLSELLIQKDTIPDKKPLLIALHDASESISNYTSDVTIPEARDGALLLHNLHDYQEQLLQEIRIIRRIMANVDDESNTNFNSQDAAQFLTMQEYNLNILLQNLNLNSTTMRHSLRLTIAIVFAFLFGTFFEIQNTYWILLTVIVIMRPNFGLTKERSKDRIIGTLVGAVVAVAIVLLTQNLIIYGILAFISLVLSFALTQQNYKFAAALITITIVFVYSFINPNAFEVIQYRVLDTVIGSAIAVAANYLLFPSWEADNLQQVLLTAFKKNRDYLLATQNSYKDFTKNKFAYNLARKEAFLAMSNLNAAFQRLTQDPKSKQKEFQLIYEIVTLHQNMISAIASIGNFVSNHKTTNTSEEFDHLIAQIAITLKNTLDTLSDNQEAKINVEKNIEDSQKKLFANYKELSNLRDRNINRGQTEIDSDTLHGLQEAYLIANNLIWLQTISENLDKAINRYHTSIALN
ncbi:FUSC family protein [Flavobacterium algicola]|uniref:FUSC family protein n=1 Tax=Flavobacterium algicola TaxID=556529 RepID=UPI001EFE9FA3|nr:FUSC family membrane protein [Flavobacterium algicola]MCG9791310.1 FUSC family protein [Flavobacterium algicola]